MLMRSFNSKKKKKSHSNKNILKGKPQKTIKRNAEKKNQRLSSYYSPLNWSAWV